VRLPFGFEITRRKHYVPNGGSWYPVVREPFTGAWQQNREIRPESVLAHHAVYACITLISSDIGKLSPKLVSKSGDGIWEETTSPAFSPVLRKPNRYQNHIQFKEWWVTSKLVHGNAYALKGRDERGVVTALYLLDPSRVKVLVAPTGDVFYQLGDDNLAAVDDNLSVPAREIIHDRINCLFHPLVGTSPIFASGQAALMGLSIGRNASAFFDGGSNPSGLLLAPGSVTKEKAEEMSERWNANYTGAKSGRVAVLGDGLTFEPLRMTAVDAQMIEHLKWTAETVCSTFHVPPFKIGIGTMPTYQNGEILNQIYYSDCLQSHIEQMELALDEGLGLTEPKGGTTYGVELDLDALLRMDTATHVKTLGEGVLAAIYTPNEARRRMDLPPKKGGDTPYLQQQNFSLAALDERDRNSPFAKPTPAPLAGAEPPEPRGLNRAFWMARLFEDTRKVLTA
jgi:HK97 family phage portal protein